MKRLIYLFLAVSLLAACNPDTIDFSNAGEDINQLVVRVDEELQIPDTLSYVNDNAVPISYVDLGISDQLGVKFQVPVIPDEYIEPSGLIDQFRELAKFTNGAESYVDAAREVTSTCLNILDTHLVDNTDLVFLIDATASMQDDIANVKAGVVKIIENVAQHENVRVGVAIYRDVADGGAPWYDYLQLTTDFDSVIDYVNAIVPCCGSTDWAESVYDGACNTLDTMEWRHDSPKMILLIGDAPALLGPKSKNTLKDVVGKSKENGVHMNFYPIIVTTEIAVWDPAQAAQLMPFMEKMYPNPTVGATTIELRYMAFYKWKVTDMGGSMLLENSGYTNRIQLDLSELPNGVYNVQVTMDGVVENQMIVVAH